MKQYILSLLAGGICGIYAGEQDIRTFSSCYEWKFIRLNDCIQELEVSLDGRNWFPPNSDFTEPTDSCTNQIEKLLSPKQKSLL